MRNRVGLWIAAPLALLWIAPAQAQVTGAGSTFAYRILAQWSHDFQAAQADEEYQPVGAALDYEPIGSQAGMMRVRAGEVDFGATDVPLPAAELAKLELAQFPFVIGGIVVVANIEGIEPGQLRLTGELLADIYLAKITSWADPAIKALNPDLELPEAPIVVVHRTDGSGTTFTFTGFLADHSPPWRGRVGRDLVVRWPTGTGAKGNDGMAAAVGVTRNAIGYVDFAQAREAGLSYALIRNDAQAFVRPSVESFEATAAGARWDEDEDFDLLLADSGSAEGYPIVQATFALMPLATAGSLRSRAALGFFAWSLDHGAAAAAALGYVALPPALVAQVKDYWTARLAATR